MQRTKVQIVGMSNLRTFSKLKLVDGGRGEVRSRILAVYPVQMITENHQTNTHFQPVKHP